MIIGQNASALLKSFAAFIFYIVKFLLRRNQFGRFLLVTPSFMAKQVVWDRTRNRFIPFTIRDGIDLQTLKMIWLWDDYDLGKLRRARDLISIYQDIIRSGSTPLIVDLGGHSGMSASFFAYIYAEASVVVLEPNGENYELAKLNTKNFPNVIIHKMAIGDKPGHGTLLDAGLGTDAFQIDYSDSNGLINVTDMQWILSHWPEPEFIPFIVKCDIEGSEDRLFASNTNWVKKFPLLIIELHDWLFPGMGYSKNFLKLAAALPGDFVHSGENVYFIK